MLQYLSRVDIQTNNKVRLGILTNGNVWRLYSRRLSVSEDYFEIDLAKALQLPRSSMNLLDRTDDRLTADRALRLPNPPPVIRAPSAPASTAVSAIRSISGGGDLEVVTHRSL